LDLKKHKEEIFRCGGLQEEILSCEELREDILTPVDGEVLRGN
jgi:hypothetical protein